MSAPNTPASPASTVVDPSDVPTVAARELAIALKILSAGRAISFAERAFSEADLRRVEETYWELSKRSRTRKVAVLLRLRSLLEAGQSRRLAALLSTGSEVVLGHVLSAAATMRLNAKWGFNPHKIARSVSEALAGRSGAVMDEALPAAA
jgi:hypothetical protein